MMIRNGASNEYGMLRNGASAEKVAMAVTPRWRWRRQPCSGVALSGTVPLPTKKGTATEHASAAGTATGSD